MAERDQRPRAVVLLRRGGTDEEVERATGLSLLNILELRAGLAAAPWLAPSGDRMAKDASKGSIG